MTPSRHLISITAAIALAVGLTGVLIHFVRPHNAFELAAVFVIFIQMVWNIVFAVVGGLSDNTGRRKSAALVFNVRGPGKLWYITFPAIFPFIVT